MPRAAVDWDEQTTLAVLEPYFIATRERFLEYVSGLGLPTKALTRVRLECDPQMRDSERHFAGASVDGDLIAVAPEMVDLPEDTVAAMLAHEWGHILDHLFPGTFVLDEEDELIVVVDRGATDARADQARVARMLQWRDRDAHTVELVADKVAEAVIGVRIGYAGPCLLQAFGRGVPRPPQLR